MVLPSYADKPLPMEDLRVEWRRTDPDSDSDPDPDSDSDSDSDSDPDSDLDSDSETLVHLYKDGESRPQQDYQERAHFFTDQIKDGNFSLRLDDLRAEDEGEYTCTVYSKQKSVFSTKTNLVPRLLGK